MSTKPLCQLYQPGTSSYGNDLGHYLAAVSVDTLPRRRRSDTAVVVHGYAVGFGSWFFFPALAPAVAFGRAARMSYDCTGYGITTAAIDRRLCKLHRTDEAVLLLGEEAHDRNDGENEVVQLKEFVQAVKEHPWSAAWHPPTGVLTQRAANGSIARTRTRSLPL